MPDLNLDVKGDGLIAEIMYVRKKQAEAA